MGNACKPFGYSVDEGMKIFCIVEMFMAFYHLVMAHHTYYHFVRLLHGENTDKIPILILIILLLYLIMAIGLIVQAIFGFLLYFFGYKQRNVTICIIWIVAACINFGIPLVVLIIHPILEVYLRHFWTSCYLYLLYLILGVWIVYVFMKSSGGGGGGTAVAPADREPSRSRHNRDRSQYAEEA